MLGTTALAIQILQAQAQLARTAPRVGPGQRKRACMPEVQATTGARGKTPDGYLGK
jgi:hypothetical protein